MSDSSPELDRFNKFIGLNRTLLDCYAKIDVVAYKTFDEANQKDFCYQERVQVEELLVKGKVNARDFFAAARAQQL